VSPAADPREELKPQDRLDELAATVVLIRARLHPSDRLGSLIDTQGSAVELLLWAETREGQAGLPLGGESREEPSPSISEEVARARTDVAGWLDRDLDLRTVLDPTYPSLLHEVFNRPALLFLRGDWRESTDRWGIAVVGTRRPSPDGIRRAARLARELSEAGYPVVSGLAHGIDTVAHRSALDAGGRTLAVMGTGLDYVYPRSNAALAEDIVASGGALVSQFFPHQGPTRWTFPMRNAVMSGLSVATVVVEASETSGARMQARLALQHGRSVFLLRSLVEEHDWGRQMVEEGMYGTQAIRVGDATEILGRLSSREPQPDALAI
jgi:DNA processing protein